MKLSPSSLVRIIVSLIVIASLASVRAAEWTGAPNVTSGTATLWNTADNWDPSGVPGVEDDADCQMTGDDYTINYFSPMSAASVGRVLVDNDEEHTTTLNINADRFKSRASNSRSIVGPNGSVVVGAGGNARFEYYYVSGSWLYLYTDGDFTVDGGDAEFYPHTALAIRSGSTVSVKNGSLVTWTDKNIENIRVSGGILNIEGGTVTLGDGGIKLGEYSDDLGGGGADGVLNITGGSLTLNGASSIGYADRSGTLNMSGGTVTNNDKLYIGNNNWGGPHGVLNLSGGTWTQAGGGKVIFGKTRGTGDNQLNITGTGVFTTTGDMLIGDDGSRGPGSGTLTIDGGSYIAANSNDDATVDVNRGAVNLQSGTMTTDRLVANHWESGSPVSIVTFDGGSMTINNSTDMDNGSPFQVGDGTKSALLVLNGGTHSFADGLSVTNNAALQGTGTITTPADTTSTSVASGGTLIPGNSIGTLTITNDLSIANGASFDYEISSSTIHDLVAVGGDLELPGDGSTLTLNLSLVDPKKVLSPADVELFTYGTLSGYTDVNWTINLIGDYWLGTPSVSDDGNGTIYLNGITFIPEPASIALLGLGLLTLMRRNRKH